MKPKVINTRTLIFQGIEITIKKMVIKNKQVYRYFIYDLLWNHGTCGGYGYKDIERLYYIYNAWKKHNDSNFDTMLSEFNLINK